MHSDKIKVAFIGGPCTGKSTIAEFVHAELNQRNVAVGLAREFVSEDIRRNGPPEIENQVFEQLRYYLNQIWEEERVQSGHDVVVTDCPTYFSYIYALFASSKAASPRHKLVLDDLMTCLKQDASRYDKLYLLRREFPYEENGVRFHTLEQAMAVDRMCEQVLSEHGIDFEWLGGTVAERGAKVVKDVMALYTSVARTNAA